MYRSFLSSLSTKKIALAVAFFTLCLHVPVQAQKTYVISPRESAFVYRMKHPMHSWKATSKEAKGTIILAPDFGSAQIDIAIPVLSFDSGNRNRDSHMAETVESYIYSEVRFKSTQVKLDSLKTTPQGESGLWWQVRGELYFHGVTRSIACPVHLRVDDHTLSAHGEFSLKLRDFDIELPSLLGLKVKNHLEMVFDIAAHSSSPVSRLPRTESPAGI